MHTLPSSILADALAPSLARWSEGRERSILRHGLPLPPELLIFADSLGILAPIRLEIVPRVPLPLPAPLPALARALGFPVFPPAGMALGQAISAISDDPVLLRHEIVHVAQYQRLGGHLPFMRRYLYECLHFGYPDSSLEIEARTLSAAPTGAN